MRFLNRLLLLVAWFGWQSLACGQSVADTAATTLTVDSGTVAREVSIAEGRLRTTLLINRATGDRLPVSGDEFRLRLVDGRELTADDYQVVSHTVQLIEGEQAESRYRFQLAPHKSGLPELFVEYMARAGDHFLRKKLQVIASPGNARAVDWLEVESLAVDAPGELGGLGMPVYLASVWFVGLEHPAGYNDLRGGRLSCRHHPGAAEFTSKTSVVGGLGMAGTALADEFQRYLSTLRADPEPVLQYNTWYDRRGDELSPQTLEATHACFEQKLLGPYGLQFEAFVIDDGWQNRRSLWQPGSRWPQGFAAFAGHLESHGSQLGLWLPLNGFGLDTAHVAQSGLQPTDQEDHYFCLACRKYRDALRPVLEQHVSQGRLAYLKHDFNFLHCSAAGHDHLPTARHGLEANVDAELELLAYERSLNPKVFLNVTSNLWPSPWWLAHADTIWMGGPDLEQNWHAPQGNARAAEMTCRDEWLYRLLRSTRAPLPLNRLMTHGIIRGRHGGEDTSETLEEWSDYVVFTLGRGTLLQELYLSPERMPDEFWPVVGQALRWAKANTETFRHTRMIGGRPEEGAAYGYLHWSDAKGIACVRNPAPWPVAFSVDLSQRPRHLAEASTWRPLIVYPERCKLPPQESGSTLRLELPASSVTVVELYAKLPPMLELLPTGPFDLLTDATGARLIHYQPPRFEPIRPQDEPEFDRKQWNAVFPAAAVQPRQQMSLGLLQEPRGGSSLRVLGDGQAQAVSQMLAPGTAAWGLSHIALPPDLAQLDLRLWLPPTPFWPQRSTTTVVLHERYQLLPQGERVASAGEAIPAWPLVLHAGTATRDNILIDHKALARRRSVWESLGWVFVLGLAPLWATQWLAYRLTRSRPKWVRFCTAAAALAGMLLLYANTPLAAALARAIGSSG